MRIREGKRARGPLFVDLIGGPRPDLGLERSALAEAALKLAAVGHQAEEVDGDAERNDESCDDRVQRSARPFHSALPWPRDRPPFPLFLAIASRGKPHNSLILRRICQVLCYHVFTKIFAILDKVWMPGGGLKILYSGAWGFYPRAPLVAGGRNGYNARGSGPSRRRKLPVGRNPGRSGPCRRSVDRPGRSVGPR